MVTPWPPRCRRGERKLSSPKVDLRGSGLVHAFLNIASLDDLLGHPVVGASWEGCVIENLLALAPRRTRAGFYRTARGAEIDLVLEMGGKRGTWAIEIKRSPAAGTARGFTIALEDLQPDKALVVHGSRDNYPRRAGVEAIGLCDLGSALAALT